MHHIEFHLFKESTAIFFTTKCRNVLFYTAKENKRKRARSNKAARFPLFRVAKRIKVPFEGSSLQYKQNVSEVGE